MYLEYVFTLMYYMGFSYGEAMSLPIWQRVWFVDRMVEEIKNSGQSKGAHDNSPDSRAATGKMQAHAPARMRRFT